MSDLKSTNPTTEFLSFEVDLESAIHDIQFRQNGTLEKSLCELITNSVDKKATCVEVVLTRSSFRVIDNGEGFEDDPNFDSFKILSKRHIEGDARYGKFGIGRSQIMSLAITEWRSKTFSMTTDVINHASGFKVTRNLPSLVGCTVSGTFYEYLAEYELSAIIRELTLFIRYLEVPVYINKVRVNPSLASHDWDYDDDLVSIKLINSKFQRTLNLFSDGVFVKHLSPAIYGFTGDVNSKRSLTLNMARNEISTKDPSWRLIHNALRSMNEKLTKRNSNLSEDQRDSFIYGFLCGEYDYKQICLIDLIIDSQRKRLSLDKLIKSICTVCVVPENVSKTLIESLSKRSKIILLPMSELSKFGCSTFTQLVSLLTEKLDPSKYQRERLKLKNIQIVDFDILKTTHCNSYTLLGTKELSPLERCERNALQYVSGIIAKRLSNIMGRKIPVRKIHIGTSGTAIGWTDSRSMIAIDRSALMFFKNGTSGLCTLCLILIHEYTHDKSSIETDFHGLEFYEQFHNALLTCNMQSELLGSAIDSLKNAYSSKLANEGITVNGFVSLRSKSSMRLNLRDKSPTAELAFILNILGITFAGGHHWIELNIPNKILGQLNTVLLHKLDQLCRKLGHQIDKMEALRHDLEYEDAYIQIFASRMAAYPSTLKHYGLEVSVSTIQMLLGSGKLRKSEYIDFGKYVFEREFGVSSIEYTSTSQSRSIEVPEAIVDYNLIQYSSNRQPTGRNVEYNTDEQIIRHCKDEITKMVNQVSNKKLKAALCKRLLSEDLTDILCS